MSTMFASNAMAADFCWPIRVYYEDTDAGGVVYHARYLHYFERARTEWLRAFGFDQAVLANELGAAFTVANANVVYRRPARLDNELMVTVVVSRIRPASLQFEQVIRREDVVLATGSFRIGCVDAVSYRPRAIPETLVQELP